MESSSRIELERPIADAISRIRFAPTSNRLLISSWDSVLRLFDPDGCELRLEAPSGAALLDCCFESENAAFSACSDGRVRRFDFCSEVQDVLSAHDDAATFVEYHDESGLLISAGLDTKLIFHDIRMQECDNGSLVTAYSEIESLSLSGFYLMTATGKSVNVYDLRNLKGPIRSTDLSLEYRISCVRSFSNSEGYVAGSIDGRVALEFFYPCKDKELSCIFRCHPKSKDRREHLVRVNDITFHPSHDTFVTGDNDGHAIMWDALSKKRLLELPRYLNSISSLSYNNDGQKLAVAVSFTYEEANEIEELPEVFIYDTTNLKHFSKEKYCC